MTLELSTVITIVGIAASGGVAVGVSRAVLNGSKAKLEKLSDSFTQHLSDDHRVQLQMVERLARIETKLDKTLGIHGE